MKKLPTKAEMTETDRLKFEQKLGTEFLTAKDDTKHELALRVSGVPSRNGGTGSQFAGYTQLERFYRGDQWFKDEPVGASQRTDNYMAVIVDNLSSLVFDDDPEINCPTDDPADDLLEIKAELKENLILRVWEENGFEVEFDEWSKTASLYGDGFMIGPWAEKDDDGKWVFRFRHVENPGSIRPLWDDGNFKRLHGFIESEDISYSRAERLYGDKARARGITIVKTFQQNAWSRVDPSSQVPMVHIDRLWTANVCSVFLEDKLVDYFVHNWNFVPLEHVKNIHVPNHPYGKSDIEDVLDPQMMLNRTNNDLANLLKWISTVNMWGKNLEGMEALVAGLSKIYSLPEDGELHTFEKPGDPYITNTFAQQRKGAIVDLAGVSESMLSGSQLSASSGRALAMAFQGTIRKLNPRMKRFSAGLESINRNTLKLYEIYYPDTKLIIQGDYRNKVHLPATILRNIIDTINKLQSGIISLDTAQREAGVKQPRLEQKLMKKTLADPILGPQTARQPQLLPRLQEGQNGPGEQPIGGAQQATASPDGAAAMSSQQASGGAPVPVPAVIP